MVRLASTPRMTVVGLLMVAAALGLFLMPARAAPPQQPPYPPPCPCVVVVSVPEATLTLGDCTPITCKVSDTEGAPVVNLECTMSVISQPGTEATLTPASAVTDEKGEATVELCVGRTPGSIVVLAETECCDSQGQVEVLAQPPPPLVVMTPTPEAPPPTGAGTGGGDSSPARLIAISSAIVLAAGALLVWRIGRRQRRSS